jgi:hypothetical protein
VCQGSLGASSVGADCKVQDKIKLFSTACITRHYKDVLGEHGNGIDCAEWLEQAQGINIVWKYAQLETEKSSNLPCR